MRSRGVDAVLLESAMGLNQAIGVVVEVAPVGGVLVSALLVDGIDGVWGALVVIAPRLPWMIDGGQAAVRAVVRNKI